MSKPFSASIVSSAVRDTINLAKKLNPNYVLFSVFCPYPATEIYKQGLETGVIQEDVWSKFALNPEEGFELPVWEENFTREELKKLLVKCYRDYYLRPGYIVKGVSRVRSFGELARKTKAGMSVLTMNPNGSDSQRSLSRKVKDIFPHFNYDVHQ